MIASSYVPWANALAWPVVVVIAVSLLLLTRPGKRVIDGLRRSVTKVDAFGISVELTPESAEETRRSFEEGFALLRANVVREMDASVRAAGTDTFFASLVESLIEVIGRPAADENSVRATLWIQDLVFSQSLYQLLDYYPRQAGNERGRTMSQRFGIAGFVWRACRIDELWGTVGTSPGELIRNWGMTRQEATKQGQGRHSFYAVPLFRRGLPIGVFYMDATGANVFDAYQVDLLAEILNHRDRLCESVEMVRTQVVNRTPNLPSFDL
jgi:hypothetical protein